MGSHVDSDTLDGIHRGQIGGVEFDCHDAIALENIDSGNKRETRVRVKFSMPRTRNVKATLYRWGVGEKCGTVRVEERVSVSAVVRPKKKGSPRSFLTAAMSAMDKKPKSKRNLNIPHFETEVSVMVPETTYLNSDKKIMRNSGGDISVLYHTSVRVAITGTVVSRLSSVPFVIDLYVKAPRSLPVSPVACPRRGMLALNLFCRKDSAADSFTVADVSVLDKMARSGDNVHAALAAALWNAGVAGFVAGGVPVVLAMTNASIFRIPGVRHCTISEAFVAFSLLTELPAAFCVQPSGMAVEMDHMRWAEMTSMGVFKVHGPGCRPSGPILRLKPPRRFRNSSWWWFDPDFVPRLPSLYVALSSHARRCSQA